MTYNGLGSYVYRQLYIIYKYSGFLFYFSP